MLAVSIKNSILILLIILILHFLIKNTLMEKRSLAKQEGASKQAVESFVTNTKAPAPASPKEASNPAPVQETKKECDVVEVKERNTDQEREELLKYVFGEDAKMGDDDLNQFFRTASEDVPSTTQGNPCPLPRTDASSLPVSTTCDPSLLSLSLEKDRKKPASDKCVKQDVRNGMVLQEYDNESGMNGGLFGGLNAFDGFSSSFGDYAPCS